MTQVTLHQGDNRETLRRLIDAGVRVHSVVTDPPYGLVSITKRFGKDGAAPARSNGATGVFGRAAAGFMGSQWDGTGIERDPEFWRLIWEILLPGGYCLAFSGSRTGHWQACAMEQAGFIMHPMTGWCFGSGFPKAHDAAKAIDKLLGQQGAVVPSGAAVKRMIPGATQYATGQWEKSDGREYQPGDYEPAAAAAAEWQGWAYGAQTLKPALEPIYIGQKPFSEKTGAANLVKHGVGAFNVDGCRVATVAGETIHAPQSDPHKRGTGAGEYCVATRDTETMHAAQRASVAKTNELGRHPANLITDGSEAVRALFPDSSGSGAARKLKRSEKPGETGWGMNTTGPDSVDLPDAGSGSAVRFFNTFALAGEDWQWFAEADHYEDLRAAGIIGDPAALSLYYHAKASTRDRVSECTTCGQHLAGAKPDCDCRDAAGNRTLRSHPTVKPVALMQHLVRLVTPPGGTVLDPFAGTGTTGAAARAEGFDCVLMEAEDAYCRDIQVRLGLGGQSASGASLPMLPTIKPAPIVSAAAHLKLLLAM